MFSKLRIAVVIAPLVVGALASAQQVSPIEARLTIPDTKVLPGVPFDMWVDVHNPSDGLVTIGLFPRLIVRTDAGKSFEIASNAGDYPVLLRSPRTEGERPVSYLTLAPGERRTLTFPAAEAMAGLVFFRDPRVMPPGRYTVSLRLEAFPIGLTEPPPLTFLGSVITNDAFIERVEPSGADARVWSRMEEIAGGKWALQPPTMTADGGDAKLAASVLALWAEILNKYPDSNYVPYALLISNGVDQNYAKSVLAAIAKFPSSPVVEYLDARARDFAFRFAGPAVFERESAKVQSSKRPTTRVIAFGREDAPRANCGPDLPCER